MNLPTMRTRVRRDLRDEDAANERWSDDTLDRHIDRAVRELSLATPREAVTTLAAPGGTRDLDIAALTDRVSIEAVEYPPGQYPPSHVTFSAWSDTLSLLIPQEPAAAEQVTVRYTQLHTLDGEGTTVPDRLHDLVATGAGGYAAIEWASFATNRVNVGGDDAWQHYHTWGQERLAAFAKALAKHGRDRQVRSRRLYLPAEGALGPREAI
ncbi:MAG: hypothetical protein GEU80_14200 [Dehalococcoidia bacterium]|nr:hypothetical protein [Dehalococcoidia bacterium]